MKIYIIAFILLLSCKSFAKCQVSQLDYDVRGLDYNSDIYQDLKQQLEIKGYHFHPTTEDYQWGHAVDQKNSNGLKISLIELYSGDPELTTSNNSDDFAPIVENADRFLGIYVTIDNLADRTTIYHYNSSEYFYRLFCTPTPLETLKKLIGNLPACLYLQEQEESAYSGARNSFLQLLNSYYKLWQEGIEKALVKRMRPGNLILLYLPKFGVLTARTTKS